VGVTEPTIFYHFKNKQHFFNTILEKGMNSGEFIQIEIDATANVLLAMINGLMRQKIAALDALKGVELAAIEFCRNALLAKK
jgi:AcrR family transcriptional regulator